MPIPTVLELLSRQTRVNIVTSTTVTGSVSANLYDVTIAEALDAILFPNQLGWTQRGSVIFVAPPAELVTNGPPPEARVFTLYYVRRREIINAVTALLGPQGLIPEVEEETAGSDTDYFPEASDETVLVIDTPERLDAIADLIATLDVRPQQVLIEATILRASLTEDNQLGVDLTLLGGIDFNDVNSTSDASSNLTTGQTPPSRFDQTTVNVSSRTLNGFPEGGFTFGIISNDVAAFVRALEQVTDVTVLAHPKVVTLNRQEANVLVGRRDGYLTTTVTETAAVQEVEFLETGVQITLRPWINPDGTVRLDVRPRDSNGGLNADNLPFEETTEASAQILVEDGNTVLIGGLFRERTVHSRSQVPGVGNIPLLGALVQNTSDSTVREEVVILLTVRILKDTPREREAMAQLKRDVETYRIGARRGLMGHGRERLSQAYFREAVKQLERGELRSALLNTRLSLHNQPRHAAATRLEERLLNELSWDSDASHVRTFLVELLDLPAARYAPPTDALGRPPVFERLLQERSDPRLDWDAGDSESNERDRAASPDAPPPSPENPATPSSSTAGADWSITRVRVNTAEDTE